MNRMNSGSIISSPATASASVMTSATVLLCGASQRRYSRRYSRRFGDAAFVLPAGLTGRTRLVQPAMTVVVDKLRIAPAGRADPVLHRSNVDILLL